MNTMNVQNIEKKFEAMGARFKFEEISKGLDFAVDIQRDSEGSFFQLRAPGRIQPALDVSVPDVQVDKRHLLMFIRDRSAAHRGKKEQIDRFLCGHDERDWFAAAVPGRSTTVTQSMIALQPPEVRQAAERAGLNFEERLQRHNRAFLRQGEWFFIPQKGMDVNKREIHYNEPIRRGHGKPHMCEELYRAGGIVVRVSGKYPNGLTESEYQEKIQKEPDLLGVRWEIRTRDAGVYVRGNISHSDHATLKLNWWHQVVMNTESRSRTMRNLAFLD